MAGFFSNFANAVGQYEARKSPLAAGLYQATTGKSPFDQSQQKDPGQVIADAIIPRYRRNAPSPTGQPTQPGQPGAQAAPAKPDATPKLNPDPAGKPTPLNPDAGSADIGLMGGQAPTYNISVNSQGQPGSGGGGYQPGGDSGSIPSGSGYGYGTDINGPLGVFSTWQLPPQQPPQGTSTSTITYPGYEGGGDGGGDGNSSYNGNYGGDADYNPGGYARGGFAGNKETVRVAESGPEMAGGKIVSSPSIVSLNKGDSVIPLTPRPGNKFQPDLLEGHIAPPKVPGIQYSRYKSYGQGRGLMR